MILCDTWALFRRRRRRLVWEDRQMRRGLRHRATAAAAGYKARLDACRRVIY